MRKNGSLALILLLMVSSLVMVKFAQAQTAPSVPEFTVQLTNSSQYVNATYTTDPYTGQQVLTQSSGYFEKGTILFTIKNQPYTPHYNGSNQVYFLYNVRYKGHFGADWIEFYNANDGYWRQDAGSVTYLSVEGNYAREELTVGLTDHLATFPVGRQVDFQMQAMIGYIHPSYNNFAPGGWVFEGVTSGWSSTQTITIDKDTKASSPTAPSADNSTSHLDQSQNTTSSSTDQPSSQNTTFLSLDWVQTVLLFALVIIATAVIVIAVVSWKKKSTTKQN